MDMEHATDMEHPALVGHSGDPAVEDGFVGPVARSWPGDNNQSLSDPPDPRYWTILRIRHTPRCHGNPTFEQPPNRVGILRLLPPTAAIPRTDGALPSRSRSRADTPKTHTHMQQVARCAHVYITGGSDGFG